MHSNRQAQAGQRGFSDFVTYELDTNTDRRNCFLISQCKSHSGEGQLSVWAEGTEQLIRYFSFSYKQRHVQNLTPKYGVLVIESQTPGTEDMVKYRRSGVWVD